ncbi:Gfo/Idh/MocA family protein [Pseudolysinimonas sp.]
MTENGLRWGILGAGGIAKAQVKDMKLHGFDVAAVAARDLAKAQAWADEMDVPRAYGSYEELAADPEIDAVYVATIHPAHAETAKIALEAGKHVLVEKPFTMDAAEARSLVDLAASKGVVVLEAMWTRWLPHMVRIREILAAGELGDVRTVLADHDQLNEHVPRMYDPALGGGALLDLGIYPVSFAWDVLGAPESVLASGTLTDAGVDRETAIILRYPSGAHAVLQTQMSGVGPNRAAIVGTKGRIEIESVWYNQVPFTRYDERGEVVERFEETAPGRGMHFQAAELERIVASGQLAGEILPPEQTVAIMETMDRIRGIIGLDYAAL